MKQRASFASLPLFFSILVLLALSCDPTDPTGGERIVGVTLDKTELSIPVGDSYKLSAKILKYENTDPLNTVSWISSNVDVASVNASGLVYAWTPGTATITVTTDEGGKTADCLVTVYPAVGVESVAIEQYKEIGIGESFTLVPAIEPENATNKTVFWYSDNIDIAKVNSGVVTGLGAGLATITVVTASNGRDASCEVTVSPIPLVSFDISDATVPVGGAVSLSAIFTPEDATHRILFWTSEDEAIAVVDSETGLVTGVAAGTVVIGASHPQSGMDRTCTVTVTE